MWLILLFAHTFTHSLSKPHWHQLEVRVAKKTDTGQAGFVQGVQSLVGGRQVNISNLTRMLRWEKPRALEAQRVTQSEVIREGLPKRVMIKGEWQLA